VDSKKKKQKQKKASERRRFLRKIGQKSSMKVDRRRTNTGATSGRETNKQKKNGEGKKTSR